jgi:hypothetical protein
MLRVKIELDTHGLGAIKDIWTADLWNDGTGDRTKGNYKFKIYQKNSTETVWKGGEVKDFQRLRWSVWYLLYLYLKKIYQ